MTKTVYSLVTIFSAFMLSHFCSIAQTAAGPGDLIISEIMVNPSAVSDTKGEWIELFNPGDQDLILNDLNLFDLGSNAHIIASDSNIICRSQSYFILARNADETVNGGIQADYVYTGMSLGNSEDEIIISNTEGEIIDALIYTDNWEMEAGSSIELDPAKNDTTSNNDSQNWHSCEVAYGDGDYGTPGQKNTNSTRIIDLLDQEYFEAFPNPCENNLFMRFNALTDEPVKITLINVLGQQIPLYDSEKATHSTISVDFSQYERGIYWIQFAAGETNEIVKIIRQ